MVVRRVLPFLLLSLIAGPALLSGCSSTGPGAGDDGGGDDDDDNGADGGGHDVDAGGNATCTEGLGAWTGHDNVAASQNPPCGLAVAASPLFVSIGWDDNGDPGGMAWALGMLADRGVKNTFYLTSVYGQSSAVVDAWRNAYAAGHEIGNHTVQHLDGKTFSADMWNTELTGCTDFITGTSPPVVPADEIYGFRTPFLSYNDDMLATVDSLGFRYDCSIEEGYEDEQDGTNLYWPYTLDNRSPGHTVQVSWGEGLAEIEPHPGLWEMPVYALFVPPDSQCEAYGVPSGLRGRLKTVQDWFDVDSGSITGFDYNLWAVRSAGGFEMSKAEFLATMKYSFDQRMKGNRAPFLLGAHTAYYVDSWSQNAPGASSARERQEAIEEFLDYVKSKPEVRIVPVSQILDWVRNPEPL